MSVAGAQPAKMRLAVMCKPWNSRGMPRLARVSAARFPKFPEIVKFWQRLKLPGNGRTDKFTKRRGLCRGIDGIGAILGYARKRILSHAENISFRKCLVFGDAAKIRETRHASNRPLSAGQPQGAEIAP